jgi:hypothetical protein
MKKEYYDLTIFKVVCVLTVAVLTFISLLNKDMVNAKLDSTIERQESVIREEMDLRKRIKFLEEHLFTLQKLTFKMAHGLMPHNICKECHLEKFGICEGCHGVKGV